MSNKELTIKQFAESEDIKCRVATIAQEFMNGYDVLGDTEINFITKMLAKTDRMLTEQCKTEEQKVQLLRKVLVGAWAWMSTIEKRKGKV